MSVAPQLALVAAVFGYAALQAVFGVGLLVFGTPTLLLLGFPFDEVLAYLLPSSIVISAVQIAQGGGSLLNPLRVRFLLLSAPAVLVATFLVLLLGRKLDARPLVGVALLLTTGVRASAALRQTMEGWVRRRLDALLVLLGLVHGATNLGGGLLACIVGSLSRDKHEIRRQIAFCYALMALAQLATLFAARPPAIDLGLCLLLPVLALASYFLIGQRMFRSASAAVYQRALTGLIGAFGILLVLAAWPAGARPG